MDIHGVAPATEHNSIAQSHYLPPPKQEPSLLTKSPFRRGPRLLYIAIYLLIETAITRMLPSEYLVLAYAQETRCNTLRKPHQFDVREEGVMRERGNICVLLSFLLLVGVCYPVPQQDTRAATAMTFGSPCCF